MAVVSVSSLLESGVHYGHQKKRWNPKMGEYIWGPKEDIHLIDIYKTAEALEVVAVKIKEIVEKGGQLLFVGTKKQAQESTKEEALRCKMFFMNQRWLGGTLTNFKTIRERIKRIEDIEKMETDGTFELLPKKEVFGIKKEYEKLNLYLQGIREMRKMPGALIVVDTLKEVNAIREAKKLNIPVFGIIDTNCDPDVVDYVIPANDDAIKSIKIIFAVIANAVNQVNGGDISDFVMADMDKKVNLAEVAAKPFAPRKDNRNFNNNRGFNRYNNDTRSNTGNGYNNDNRNNTGNGYNSDNRNNSENRYNNDNRNSNENRYNNNNRPFERRETVATPATQAPVEKPREVVQPVVKEVVKTVTQPVVKEVKKVEVKEDLSKFTVAKLKEIAKEKGITGYTTMKKDELVTALS